MLESKLPPLGIRGGRVSSCSFYVFCSRAKGTAKTFSDLDLAVNEALSARERSLLETMFEKSNLPFKVDLVELQKTNETFKKGIASDLVDW